MEVSVTTNKYSYRTGELVEITLDGNWSAIYYEIGSIGYMIYDLNGNFIVEQIHKIIICPVGDPIEWWYGPEVHYWNQTYKVYDKHTQNIFLDKWPDLISPSGKQVPSGKYNVFASINGRDISEPVEFEIISTNQPPVADAGEDIIIEVNPLIPSAFFALNGSGSYDPDGTIVDYHWDFGDGTNGSGEIVFHGYSGPGNYTVVLTVTDDDGATDTDSILVIVLVAPWQSLWTDKYRYCVGEPVVLTYKGIHDPYAPCTGHFLILNESGDIVFWFGPVYHPTVVAPVHGTVSYSWNQTYQVFDLSWQPISPTGEQVPPGKYYAWYSEPFWPGFGPVEFEIMECPGLKIDKEKISGLDEVITHTYNKWELKITINGVSSSDGYENVNVYDVLPAELKLLDYELTQGALSVLKKGKGKMGSTHLTWNIGDLNGEAELILKIGTRKNPAGKQEFTSPGKYLLNEGASVEGTDSSTGKTIKVGPTEPIFVSVLKN
ncbi:MAG: PKD domain-containing protein [Thermoplasmata archaeon]|nr:MAG: PKD domain-containing protein [Thermoplasmata archaeon]